MSDGQRERERKSPTVISSRREWLPENVGGPESGCERVSVSGSGCENERGWVPGSVNGSEYEREWVPTSASTREWEWVSSLLGSEYPLSAYSADLRSGTPLSMSWLAFPSISTPPCPGIQATCTESFRYYVYRVARDSRFVTSKTYCRRTGKTARWKLFIARNVQKHEDDYKEQCCIYCAWALVASTPPIRTILCSYSVVVFLLHTAYNGFVKIMLAGLLSKNDALYMRVAVLCLWRWITVKLNVLERFVCGWRFLLFGCTLKNCRWSKWIWTPPLRRFS